MNVIDKVMGSKTVQWYLSVSRNEVKQAWSRDFSSRVAHKKIKRKRYPDCIANKHFI